MIDRSACHMENMEIVRSEKDSIYITNRASKNEMLNKILSII